MFPGSESLDKEVNRDSILISVKKLLGIDADYHVFDADLILHINSVFFIMAQMGIISYAYSIDGEDATWDDVLQGRSDLEAAKTYVYAKVKQIFDPPTGAVAEALNNTVKELEWRLFSATDLVDTKPEDIVPYEENH